MTMIGYAYKTEDVEYLSSQLECLDRYGCDRIVLEKDNLNTGAYSHIELDNTISNMEAGDRLVIFELVCLGKSIIKLGEFIMELLQKGIDLIVLNSDGEFNSCDTKLFTSIALNIAKTEKLIIRKRTTKGLKEARLKGNFAGRPRIPLEVIERVRFLYLQKRYTLREIANECRVSVGTVYNYAQDENG